MRALLANNRFGWPNDCPHCGLALPSRALLRPQDHSAGQRCPACKGYVAYIPEPLHGRTWWVPVRPRDRYSRMSGKEIVTPNTVEWEELGGGPARAFCTVDPSRTLVPRSPGRPWRGAEVWRVDVSTGVPITAVILAREMLVTCSENGTLRWLDPKNGRQLPHAPLSLQEELAGEPLRFPPACRGGWMAVAGGRGLVLVDLTPLTAARPGLVRRKSVVLPHGSAWYGAPMVIDRPGESPLFAGLAVDDPVTGRGSLKVYDPAPIRDDAAPRLVVEIPMAPAALPIQVPVDLPRAGEILWVGRDGGLFSTTLDAPTPRRLTPPPMGARVHLDWYGGNLAIGGDRPDESVWMVHTDARHPVLKRWRLSGQPGWTDAQLLDPENQLRAPWIAVQTLRMPDSPEWVVVAGAEYYEVFRRNGLDHSALNVGDRGLNRNLAGGLPAKTVAPPILTPAGLLTFHPLKIRLGTQDRAAGIELVEVDAPLSGEHSNFSTFAAACGATAWCGTEGGAVTCVAFQQESA